MVQGSANTLIKALIRTHCALNLTLEYFQMITLLRHLAIMLTKINSLAIFFLERYDLYKPLFLTEART